MDTIKSFKGYGKVDPVEEQAFRRKTRKRLTILIVSVVLLLAVIIGAVAGTLIHNRNKNSNPNSQSSQLSSSQSIKAVCSQTLYPESCYTSISDLNKSNSTDPEELLKLSLQAVLNALSDVATLPKRLSDATSDDTVKKALDVCQNVLDDAVDYVKDSISSMDVKSGEKLLNVTKIDDLKTWLSTTITNQETCLDALQEINSTSVNDVTSQMKNSSEYSSNSLAIVSKISGILGKLNFPIHRKLLSESEPEFPGWVSPSVRKLLQAARPVPNVTVAVDGTGDVKTIKEAMARVPKKSKTMFVIHIKAGKYLENVVLDKSFWNVMIYGDGKDKTIISASLNFIDGTPTFSTATFAVAGKGFIAMDIRFENTAGAAKHQAVAFRSGSDFSVFYRCSFDAFQDTLYPHSNRQFYRECDVTGTIDFIFGNAAVVFQSCKIMPRQPLSNQFVTITAQGKKDPNQNTGISIQKCDLSAFDKLTAPTYLGRPWKEYSTTVIMQSTIGGFLNPVGWISWVQGVDPPASIFYGEYMNTGAGAGVSQRVKWAGYKPSLTTADANKFTVESFIEGSMWLPQTSVAFDSAL
ncbi:pectinesterase 1 [Rutidosis leptorrhynchoides]|uniref:pectinesterase 1 n=1 Tax=Rutidosis leptorrhynchoides TaxID=125765 RepID=UPI003A9A1129